jgi:hypothetical protein
MEFREVIKGEKEIQPLLNGKNVIFSLRFGDEYGYSFYSDVICRSMFPRVGWHVRYTDGWGQRDIFKVPYLTTLREDYEEIVNRYKELDEEDNLPRMKDDVIYVLLETENSIMLELNPRACDNDIGEIFKKKIRDI